MNLLADRKFWPLFWTQFFGALNDNFFKNALVVLITFRSANLMGLDAKNLVALASAIFIFPFFILSPLAGQICDKFEKSYIARMTKVYEIFIMVIASIGFYSENYYVLLFGLFLMGAHSTIFGPLKYSMIPELVEKNRLTEGNAYVELGTFISILIGTILGGLAVAAENRNLLITTGLMTFAIIGLWTSLKMSKVKISSPDIKINYNPFPSLKESMILIANNRTVFNTILGISWFWFFGAGVLSVLPVYCKDYLGVNEQVVTLFLATFTIGIGAGSMLCNKLSFGRVEIGLVPIGSLGISVFLTDLAFVTPEWVANPNQLMGLSQFLNFNSSWRLVFDFTMMSLFAGIFTVPLYTLVQERSPKEFLSRVIASNNILNAIFMVVSSVMLMGFYALDFSMAQIFLAYATLNILVAIYVYSLVPEFTLRFYSWILSRLLYRIRTQGLENIPAEGPVILASNHVSYIDWLLIAAVCHRPARFIMYYKFYQIPILGRLIKQGRAIPIAGRAEDPKILQESFERIEAELKAGEVVCIFPEGGITRDGELQSLKPGILKMLQKVPEAQVVPLSINGLWGSIFSRKDIQLTKKRPRKLWQIIEIKFGPTIPTQGFRLETLEKHLKNLSDS